MIEVAVSGLGIAIAPQILVEKEMLNGGTMAPFGFIFIVTIIFYAMVRKNNENHDVINIIDWLMAKKKDLIFDLKIYF